MWEGEHGGQYANLVVSANAEPGGPIHIAFVARSRDEVNAFHRAGVEAVTQTTARRECARNTARPRPAAITRLSSSIPRARTLW